jgi:hypothetical protein
VVSWGFLTNHARALLCVAREPGVRLGDIASSLGITERGAHGFVTDLMAAGYLVNAAEPLPCPLHDWGQRSGFLGGHVTILPGISQSAPA